jgi:hypothetical protein
MENDCMISNFFRLVQIVSAFFITLSLSITNLTASPQDDVNGIDLNEKTLAATLASWENGVYLGEKSEGKKESGSHCGFEMSGVVTAGGTTPYGITVTELGSSLVSREPLNVRVLSKEWIKNQKYDPKFIYFQMALDHGGQIIRHMIVVADVEAGPIRFVSRVGDAKNSYICDIDPSQFRKTNGLSAANSEPDPVMELNKAEALERE